MADISAFPIAGRWPAQYPDRIQLYTVPTPNGVTETRRLLEVVDKRLEGREWIMGSEYSIADISMFGWVRNLIGMYNAGTLVDYTSLRNVPGWRDRGLARDAVQRGLNSPKRG